MCAIFQNQLQIEAISYLQWDSLKRQLSCSPTLLEQDEIYITKDRSNVAQYRSTMVRRIEDSGGLEREEKVFSFCFRHTVSPDFSEHSEMPLTVPGPLLITKVIKGFALLSSPTPFSFLFHKKLFYFHQKIQFYLHC